MTKDGFVSMFKLINSMDGMNYFRDAVCDSEGDSGFR